MAEEVSRPSASSENLRLWLRYLWVPFSMPSLCKAEAELFKELKSVYKLFFVPIFKDCQIRTVSVEKENACAAYKSRTPIVLLHGIGSGCALWMHNFDTLASSRPVYAIDVLGFGRSSRPTFSQNDVLAEQLWIDSLEDWRCQMNIDKMVLVGHSLGAYISASYTLEYGRNVSHLVLAEPWGFPVKTSEHKSAMSSTVPVWIRILANFISQFPPLQLLRLAGPMGPLLIRKVRPDIPKKYFNEDHKRELIFDYVYNCNVQPAAGEMAFQAISIPFAWAKRPMVNRLPSLSHAVPITFIYGSRSWIDQGPGYQLQKILSDFSPVRVEVIRGSGHHVHADQPEIFNEVVLEVLKECP